MMQLQQAAPGCRPGAMRASRPGGAAGPRALSRQWRPAPPSPVPAHSAARPQPSHTTRAASGPESAGGGEQDAPPGGPLAAAARRLPQAALLGACLALAAAQGARALAAPTSPALAPAAAQTAVSAAPRRAAPAAATLAVAPPSHRAFSAPEAVRYRVLKLFSMPTTGKLAAVLAVSIPVVLLGGLAYKTAMGCSWGQALTKAYHVMGNCPGVDITQEQSRTALLVINAVYLMGLMSFAVVLGIITDDIGSAVAQVRTGNFPVVERNHTVLLGWNRQTLPILKQIAIAQAQAGAEKPFGLPVVVLADRAREDMDGEIHEELGSLLPVITRSGSAARLEDLRRAGVGAAGTVLLSYPESRDRDLAAAEQAAALAAIKREGGPAGQKIVVQSDHMADAAALDAAAIALGSMRGVGGAEGAAAEMVLTKGEARLSQLMAQVALQPGLEYVLGDLLEFEDDYQGAEFYMAPLPQALAGAPYRDVRRSYRVGCVIGFMQARGGGSGKLMLNPRESEAVPAGSQLVFVTSSLSVEQAAAPAEPAPLRLRRARSGGVARKHIAVLCFGGGCGDMLASLGDFAPRGSRVTLVSSDPDAKEAVKPLQKRGVRVATVAGSPASGGALRAARLDRADAVVMCGLGADPSAADTQVVASVLQLQALAAADLSAGRRASSLDVVAAVNAPSTEEVLWHATLSHEAEAAAAAAGGGGGGAALADLPAAVQLHMLNPDQLMSGMVTQAAIEPRLNRVFAELFTSCVGQEIYLKRASCFGLPPAGAPRGAAAPATWAQVQEAARARGQTAIGVAPARGGPDAIRLAPAADEVFELSEADEIVVIADN
ncbi:MAG: hypothetical protein J3K34DRAFT_461471 [Monoraphidium minutum]|nr:MAG: hypothetical protein J3K34DRAFT_461471 [Monoraphidium minutum]